MQHFEIFIYCGKAVSN